MKFKNSNYAFAIIWFIFSAVIIIILAAAIVIITINPSKTAKLKRDKLRKAELLQLAAAIESYYSHNDFRQLPAQDGASHISTDGSPPENSAGGGWIPADLTAELSVLPKDLVNNGKFFYRYFADPTQGSDRFKIDASLEADFTAAENDGGVDPARFEVGTDKSLLPP